jgi:hypothetical protein
MNRIFLVIGYYYNNNLGDDLFIETIPNFFPNSTLEFVSADTISEIDFNKYEGIIFGGGDLVNSYFNGKVSFVRNRYAGPIFAFSIGIPYFETIGKGHLNLYDHVFTRNKKYLIPLQHALGSQYVHYLPDAVMTLSPIPAVWSPEERQTVGIFLPSSICTPRILFKLCHALRRLLGINPWLRLYLACFDTKNDSPNHDKHINTKIEENLSEFKDRIYNDQTRYNGQEMVRLIAGFKFCIASRFHSHILSILTETPFFSFHYANKVSLLMEEKDLLDLFCPISITGEAKPDDFSIEIFMDKFNYVNSNLLSINERIKAVKNHDKYLCKDNYQVEALLSLGERRRVTACSFFVDKVDLITKKYTKKITDITGQPLEKSANILSKKQSIKLSRGLLYEITGEISCRGVDGTIDNLIKKPQTLREMVDWVWKDKRVRMSDVPRFNMQTTCTQSFCGLHRAGWKYVLDSIHSLHSEHGVILDVYCDATFGWCRETPCQEYGIIPYTSPWCGFFHHTPFSGNSDNNITHSTDNPEFKKSLETCLGFFVMSEWLAQWLRKRLTVLGYEKIPVVSLIHPTLIAGIIPFALPKEEEKLDIVNVGAWLRNTYSIYALDLPKNRFNKYKLRGKMMENYFPPSEINFSLLTIIKESHKNSFLYCLYKYIRENKFFFSEFGYSCLEDVLKDEKLYDEYSCKIREKIMSQIETVNVLEHLPDKEYDLLMAKYIVFVDFIECSAANTLIECMARGNPIIVNRIPAVVEHLGPNYPLYFDNLEEIPALLTYDRISAAEKYMKRTEITEKISSEKFYQDLSTSTIAEASRLKPYLVE